jgi:hypothetical protein
VKNSTRGTQRSAILNVLISAHGDWVPLPKITNCAAQYNARLFELRRLGFRIANRTQDVGGVRHSWFRLESGASQVPSPKPAAPVSHAPSEPLPLFAEVLCG